MTPRFRKRGKDRSNLRSDHRNRHLSLVSLDSPASAGGGADPYGSSESAIATSRHSMASHEDVVVSGQSGSGSYTSSARGTTDFELVVPQVDRQSLDPPTEGGEQTQAATERPRRVDVHPRLRGKLVRLGRSVLGWPADGHDVPRGVRLGVLEPPWHSRSLACLDSDPRGPTGSRRLQTVGSSGLQPVAAHGGALWPEVADSVAEVDTVLARRPEKSHPSDNAECPCGGVASNDSSGNEGRAKRAPMPRRKEVSGPPHRAAGTGLDEASVPASFLSRWMLGPGPVKIW